MIDLSPWAQEFPYIEEQNDEVEVFRDAGVAKTWIEYDKEGFPLNAGVHFVASTVQPTKMKK